MSTNFTNKDSRKTAKKSVDTQDFNIVIAGVGGQGLITLGKIISNAAFLADQEVKMSELHGLSQRGGSVAVQVRMGENIYTPLIPQAEADLVLATEYLEALKSFPFASPEKTVFLINNSQLFSPSFPKKGVPDIKKVIQTLKPLAKEIYVVEATKTVKKELDKEILAGVYLICGAVFSGLLPLSPQVLLKAIKKVLPQKFELNEQAFRLAQKTFSIEKF